MAASFAGELVTGSEAIKDILQKRPEPNADGRRDVKPMEPVETDGLRVDARGHRCPVPTLRLSRALQGAAPGLTVELITDDPLARIDAPHFVAAAGHDLIGISEKNGVLSIRVRKAV